MKIKILSWNIWIGGHFKEIKDFLRDSKADIIGLQEVKDDDKSRDVISYLSGLGYQHVFTPVIKVSRSKKGVIYRDGPAVFSKHNIVGSEIHNLSKDDNRVAVRADIEIDAKQLHVFSTHLIHTHQRPLPLRESQVDSLIKVLPSNSTVVMGDFNATPEDKTIQKIKTVLVDTDPLSTPTWSNYPEGCPTCNPQKVDTRLDYIFVTKDLKTDSFKVEESKGSDHLPISVAVEL